MQPLWESVKRPDGGVNFGLSYHRTMYESQYDDFHDIFLQRWRKEDKPWHIVCVNRTDGKGVGIQLIPILLSITTSSCIGSSPIKIKF